MSAGDSLPTGLFTILITDIEGSTKLAQAVSATPYAEAVARHNALLLPVIEQQGHVKEIIGDSFYTLSP